MNYSSSPTPEAPYLELNNQGQVQQFALRQDLHRLGRDAAWADLLIPNSDWDVVSGRHAVLKREDGTYRFYDGDAESLSSRNGNFEGHRRITPQSGCCLAHGTQIQIGQNPKNWILLTYWDEQSKSSAPTPSLRRLDLSSITTWPVRLGREELKTHGTNHSGNQGEHYPWMSLDAPTVSRCHATIARQGNQYILRDHSINGTFVNQQRLGSSHVLKPGDLIHLGPFTLVFQEHSLTLLDAGNQIRLDAHNLTRIVGRSGQKTVILNQVSLAIEPGQLVAIVGGSGAGKSTLMKTLLGIEPTNTGMVFLNGTPLRKNFNRYRHDIGYVPQDDIIHLNLTVKEVLSYTCRLRLPPDIDVYATVNAVLEQVQLSHVQKTQISALSGGQRKRVSIAVELLAGPKLFFLDEPTSGLDPGLDKTMMELLRALANQGKTVVLVTHATSNLEICDRIAFMGRGGKLCYFGPPKAAMSFFEMPAEDLKYFADIYVNLDQHQQVEENVEHWSKKFAASPLFQTYVNQILSQGNQSSLQSPVQNQSKAGGGLFALGQIKVLVERELRLVQSDRLSLILMLLTAPVSIGFLSLIFREETPLAKLEILDPQQAPLAIRILFIFTCAAMWVGLSSTAQSIVREMSIYVRERLVNLGILSYILSKTFLYGLIGMAQTLCIIAAIAIGFHPINSSLITWSLGFGITTFLTIFCSACLGLMVSSLVSNSSQANSTLPLILLPQIIFSGVLFDTEGFSTVISWLMLSRWSVSAYAAIADVNAMIPIPENSPDGNIPLATFRAIDAYASNWDNLNLSWLMLMIHSSVYLGVTLYRQKQKDIL